MGLQDDDAAVCATGPALQKGISTTTKDAVYAQYAHIPRCACGGYCHKPDLPGQMWLDGLYMGGPFLA